MALYIYKGGVIRATGKYQEWLESDNLIKLEAWARNGLTDEQIAHNIGIDVATLYRWKKEYCDICNALKRGKEVVDTLVENALLKRALGYEYTETKRVVSEKDGVKVETTVKQVVPDTTAQIFWLKNRKPAEWRDKQQIDGNIQFESDGFLEALKGEVKDTFKSGGIVEE